MTPSTAIGLKYVGVGTTALGWILCAVLLGCGVTWLAVSRPRQARLGAASELGTPSEEAVEAESERQAVSSGARR